MHIVVYEPLSPGSAAALPRRGNTSRRRPVSSGRIFTLELNSRNSVKDVAAPSGSRRVVIEGTIGTLRHAGFVEDSVLELVGTGGVLRVDLSRDDLTKCAPKEVTEE